MTLTDVASKMERTPAAISLWETDKTNINAIDLIRLADIYGTRASELMREIEAGSRKPVVTK